MEKIAYKEPEARLIEFEIEAIMGDASGEIDQPGFGGED